MDPSVFQVEESPGDDSRDDAPWETRLLAGVAAAVFLLAGVLRLCHFYEGLWLDELHTSWTISGSVAEIEPRAAAGNYSTLYFYAVAAVSAFGQDEGSLRFLSMIASFAVLFAALIYGTTLQPCLGGIVALALLAIDSNAIWYAAEARPYALVQLLSLAMLVLWEPLLRSPTAWQRAAFVLLAAAMFYLHFTAALLASGLVVDYLRQRWRDGRWPEYAPRMVGLDVALLLLVCLPGGLQLATIAQRREAWAAFSPQAGIADLLTSAPLVVYFGVPLLAVLVAMLVQRPLAADAREEELRDSIHCETASDKMWLLGAWAVTPLLLAWTLAATDVARLYLSRYLVGALVALPLFTIAAAQRIPFVPARHAFYAAVLGLSLVWGTVPPDPVRRDREPTLLNAALRGFHVTPRVGEEWREAIAALNADPAGQDWPVFVRSGLIEADRLWTDRTPELVEYCLLPVRGLYSVRPENRPLFPLETTYPGRVQAQDLRRARERGGVWLLVAGDAATADVTVRDIAAALARSGARAEVADRQNFAGITLVRLTIGAANPADDASAPVGAARPAASGNRP